MLIKIKNRLEENDFMRLLLIGLGLGIVFSFIIQTMFELDANNWLWLIGIILILYLIVSIFIPVLISYSLVFAGFLIGVIIALSILIFLPEVQSFFSSIGFV